MALEIRKPKVIGLKDTFMFWLKNLEREKPYLQIKKRNSLSTVPKTCTEVWYTIKHELAWLNDKVLELDKRIIDLEFKDIDTTKFTKITVEIFELKKEVYNLRLKIKQLEKLPPNSKKLLMTYALFRDITVAFNKKAVDEIIQGKALNLGNKLGVLRIRKIDRYTPCIDWGESRNRKQELIDAGVTPRGKDGVGEDWFVYRLQDYYLRWSWVKRFRSPGIPLLKNGKLYAFYPTNSSSNAKVLGAKGLLHKANMENKLLHKRYNIIKLK